MTNKYHHHVVSYHLFYIFSFLKSPAFDTDTVKKIENVQFQQILVLVVNIFSLETENIMERRIS